MTTPPLPRTPLEPVCLALAEVVRQRRERAGLSLNQLAERTPVVAADAQFRGLGPPRADE